MERKDDDGRERRESWTDDADGEGGLSRNVGRFVLRKVCGGIIVFHPIRAQHTTQHK